MEDVKVAYTAGPWFTAEKETELVQIKDGAIPVVVTTIIVLKNEITINIFDGYQNGQVFTCEFQSGAMEDVYFYAETNKVYAFTTHPNLV